MWDLLTWRQLRAPEIEETLTGLREDMLGLFLGIIVVGYATWQLAITFFISSPADTPRAWSVFPFLGVGLAITFLLHRHRTPLAAPCLVASCVVATTAAVWYLETPLALIFYPLVTLLAVVLIHPLAGLISSLISVLLVFLMWRSSELPFLDGERFLETGVATLFTVIVAWALGRGLVTAVEWSLQSYDQARRRTEDVQVHRGQLVRAVRQLDSAYYRLQQANAALDIAWHSAETAEQSKTEFVTNISHELRTPLNLIVGFSEMIASSPESYGVPLPAAYRVDLNTINRSAQHLLALTNDVIDLTRVGMHRLALSREPAVLALIVEEACAIVRDYARVKGLWLRTTVADDLPLVEIDAMRIRQVLLNLLTNAARFTERGGITVSAEHDGEQIIVKVSDTGVGIPSDELPRVFEQFRGRGEGDIAVDGRAMKLGGFGLGLPISRRLVELHGGEIGVASANGAGSTFWFTLPLTSREGRVSDGVARPLRSPGSAATAERTLVLASPDRHLATLLRRHLRGYQIEVASDPTRAVAVAREVGAIGILAGPTDSVAPRAEGEPGPLPILRLPLPRASSVAESLGARSYLMKPVTRADLRRLLASLGEPIRRILIADDDPAFASLMNRMLVTLAPPAGFDIRTVANGRQALEAAREDRPDLVLLDLIMPELDGRATIAELQASSALADVPVVVVSAQVDLDSDLSLVGPVTLALPRGLRLDEMLGLVEAVFGTLKVSPPVAQAFAEDRLAI